MAKLAGRWLKVLLDDGTGNPQDISNDLDSINIPNEFGEIDVTGFGDGAENSMPGLSNFSVEITGTFNPAAGNGLFTVLKAINGVYEGHTLTVQVGQNAAPTSGDPEFEGEFWCQKMNVSATPTGKTVINGSLRVYGATTPQWGTVSP
jgi:hypothetical protein